jgi:DNA-binding NarL/FixJ family response regulator
MDRNLRIVIIEDDEVLRSGYRFILDSVVGYQVINVYESFDDAKKTIQQDTPDILMLDIQMPGTTGIEALPQLKKMLPHISIIMLTVYETESLIFQALSNGASGYITKNSSAQKIIDSIKEVSIGGGAMSTNVARIVMRSFQKSQNSPLTKRETEILSLIAEGKTKVQVANQLFIDQETVRSHVKNIYIKLDVNSKADAIKTAKDQRFI